MTAREGFEWDLGIVTLSTYDADGFLGLQVDIYGEAAAGCPAGEVQMPFGEMARPDDPEVDADGQPLPTAACQAMYFWYGSRLHVVPVQDTRAVPKLPMLSKGSKLLYGASAATKWNPSFHVIDGQTGDQTIYVPYAIDGSGNPTKAHVIDISASGEHIVIRHADGAGLALTSDSAVLNGPDGSTFLELQSGGSAVISGNLQIVGGLNVQGQLGIGPAPAIPMLTAAFTPSTLVMTTA